MNLRLFNTYMTLCKELNKEPTVKGLKLFKKAFK